MSCRQITGFVKGVNTKSESKNSFNIYDSRIEVDYLDMTSNCLYNVQPVYNKKNYLINQIDIFSYRLTQGNINYISYL